jgi:hypothetical protein
MTVSLYDLSVPVVSHFLNGFSRIIDKAEAHCAAKKIEPEVLLTDRLYPDMFPFTRQVQIACDFAKGMTARLAGVEVPSYADEEKTFAELKARIAKTLAFVATLKQEQFVGAETRTIALKLGGQDMSFPGAQYLQTVAMPNFYFHLTMGYAILRHNGVELGKRDFMGAA